MAEEESVKRFEAVMEKLFQIPLKSSSKKISTNLSRAEWSRDKTTPYSTPLEVVDPRLTSKGTDRLQSSSGSSIDSVQTTSCRPWDRDDLFKRLATFKSMTWFAKPQAVSALNCARRGWINVDMDIIACESCGARLLFSTPYSWTTQQVEKAAKVFSLKLDSGHKLLCPWVDNTCDESLAQFPPKSTDALVEDFKYRCSALLQLSALPVISPSVIDCASNPQLQEVLLGLSGVENNDSFIPCGNLTNEPLSETSTLYYQAQMLISLYGWEPRSMPYIVDCQKEEGVKDFNSGNTSSLAWGGPNLKVCPINEGVNDVDNGSQVSDRYAVCEPNSVVLNCKFCGASVGLWAFSSLLRPLEFLRLVGYTDINRKRAISYYEDVLADNENVCGDTSFTPLTSKDKTSSLNLTIAGGPPPEKQNYRATISLPVIGRNLRGRFSLDSAARKIRDTSLAIASTTEPGANKLSESGSGLVVTSENMQVVRRDSDRNKKCVDNLESEDIVDSVVRNSYTSQIEGPIISVEGQNTEGSNNVGEGSDAVIQTSNQELALQGDRSNDNTKDSIVLHADKSSVPGNSGKRLDHISVGFDPIRQHRIFCPWIVSYGISAPGWKQTLSALQDHKKRSDHSAQNTHSSLEGNGKGSVIEVDDPVASATKFFDSPPMKRTKYNHHIN